jgi:hypothetical protein
MSDTSAINGKVEDQFLTELEKSITAIIKTKKISKGDKIAAINAGIRLAAIKHKVFGSDPEENFFSK